MLPDSRIFGDLWKVPIGIFQNTFTKQAKKRHCVNTLYCDYYILWPGGYLGA